MACRQRIARLVVRWRRQACRLRSRRVSIRGFEILLNALTADTSSRCRGGVLVQEASAGEPPSTALTTGAAEAGVSCTSVTLKLVSL